MSGDVKETYRLNSIHSPIMSIHIFAFCSVYLQNVLLPLPFTEYEILFLFIG